MRLLRRPRSLSPSSRSRATEIVGGAAAALALALALGVPTGAQQSGPGVLPGARSLSAGGAFTSPLLAPDGTAAAPAYSFANFTNKGWYSSASDQMALSIAGTRAFIFDASTIYFGSASDVSISRDDTNVLALRNGTNAQIRTYNTYTDAANYERLNVGSNGAGNFAIEVGNAGTGASRSLSIGAPNGLNFTTAGVSIRWTINSSGHFLANDDNTYDIGGTGARPRNVLLAGSLVFPSNSLFTDVGDGILLASNNAGTGFTRLILGTNDASGVSLTKSGITLQAALGDASAYAPFEALTLKAYGPNAFIGSNTTTGTLVTNDAQTVANDAVISLGANTARGMIIVTDSTTDSVAIFALRGANNATTEVSDPAGIYSVTAGTANSFNIYWSVGNSRYELENKRGASRDIHIIRLGV